MSKYRNSLPIGDGNLYLTDGGLETTSIYHEGFDLPEFASNCFKSKFENLIIPLTL